MPKFIVGARLHDYGKGTPDELFAKVSADGFAAVQLAYKKCVPTVKSYADVTDALVADTIAAEKAHSIQVAVLGTYVELAINDESRLQNAADFKSQLAVCKALGAGCIGTETTAMSKQPAGTTREEAQELLCRSLAEILPTAEELGVTVGIEPVTLHSMNQAFDAEGGLLHTSLEESRTDYAGAFAMLRQLPQATLPVLREEAVPARAASDIAFMKGFF